MVVYGEWCNKVSVHGISYYFYAIDQSIIKFDKRKKRGITFLITLTVLLLACGNLYILIGIKRQKYIEYTLYLRYNFFQEVKINDFFSKKRHLINVILSEYIAHIISTFQVRVNDSVMKQDT